MFFHREVTHARNKNLLRSDKHDALKNDARLRVLIIIRLCRISKSPFQVRRSLIANFITRFSQLRRSKKTTCGKSTDYDALRVLNQYVRITNENIVRSDVTIDCTFTPI